MNYIQTILRSLGQVMFQNNSYSGLLFLIGIFYNSPLLGLTAILGTVISNSTAQILNYAKQDIQNGIYGFNGALTGIALIYFFGLNATTLSALILGSAVTSPVYYYLKKIVSPFTAPFVVITWLAFYFILFLFDFPMQSTELIANQAVDFISFSTKSFGQVMFQENTVTGLLFLFAIAINSVRSAIYALSAAILGSLVGLLLQEPISLINAGLMGYNAILCAIALVDNKRNSLVWITLATVLSVILNSAFSNVGIIALTGPFVLSTWLIIKLSSKWSTT